MTLISDNIRCTFCNRLGTTGHSKKPDNNLVLILEIEVHRVNYPICIDCEDEIRKRELQRFQEYTSVGYHL